MGFLSEEVIDELEDLMDQVEEPLKKTFESVHQGYVRENLSRFLKARDWNVRKAHTMLVECLRWRVDNEIDSILSKPIVPSELYRDVRDSQLIGMSSYTKEGLSVFAIGIGLNTLDKAYNGRPITTCVKVLDMTGLKLSALSQIKLVTIISTIEDLNYPKKTNTYYVVNAPYIFSACWKVVKPLLQERTREKIYVLYIYDCGKDELLKIMDFTSLPHFCRRGTSGSSHHTESANCFSMDHPFHQQLYNYVKNHYETQGQLEPAKQEDHSTLVFLSLKLNVLR